MNTSDSYKVASISNDDVCELEEKLQNMSTADVSVCANCGKEDANNICNKCKVTTYCNAVCKKVHKKKHKKECEEHVKLAAEKHDEELKRAAELHDKDLFKQPPPAEDCPICFQQLPTLDSGATFMSCCSKEICVGCIHAPVYDSQGNEVDEKKCPFCRVPVPKSYEEMIEREKNLVDLDDPIANFNRGNYYKDGRNGYPQSYAKALEYWLRAGELGYAKAYNSIGVSYHKGVGFKVDMKKAKHYYELAAMGGSEFARYMLGNDELRAGNMDRALKHHMIAVMSGFVESLNMIKEMYLKGHATKEDYTKALQSYQSYLNEIKSDQRDKAAAAREDYRYY